jgi:CheY-like chemotaxis protein
VSCNSYTVETQDYRRGAEVAAAPRATPGEAVLVVDDEELVRMLLIDALEDLGYSSLEAGDAHTGLNILRSDARIDLLVTDVGMQIMLKPFAMEALGTKVGDMIRR